MIPELNHGRADFHEFASRCARQMARFNSVSEVGKLAPIPERLKEPRASRKRLEEAEARLDELMQLVPASAEVAALAAAHNKAVAESEARDAATLARVVKATNAMVNNVVHWDAPPEYSSLKSFMHTRLIASLAMTTAPVVPKAAPETGPEWLANEVNEARAEVDMWRTTHAEDLARWEENNAWLAGLKKELAP